MVTRPGYLPYHYSLKVDTDIDFTVRMQPTPNIGITEADDLPDIKLWPNPAGEVLSWSAPKLYEVSLFSADGRLLQRTKMRSLTHRMDISSLKPGIYLLQFSDGKTSIGRRFVKL